MNRERKHCLESCEVSRLVRYELGGVEQKVTLEGRRADAPVVIFLHGGPGSPLPISVGTRGMFPDLTDRYVLAAWDQLGCGANRCALGWGFQKTLQGCALAIRRLGFAGVPAVEDERRAAH